MLKRRRPYRSLLHLERLEDRTVPAAPVNSFPGTQTVIEENALVFSAANGNGLSFTDADGPGPYQVELAILTNPNSATVAGALTVSNTAGVTITGNGTNALTILGSFADVHTALDTLTMTPSINLEGPLRLVFETHDDFAGGLADTDFININVTPNQSPTNITPGTQTTPINTPLPFSTATSNRVAVTDPDGPGPFQIEITLVDLASPPQNAGILSLSNVNGLTVIGNNSNNMIIVGSLVDVNAALETLVYQPATGFTGQSRIIFETHDSNVSTTRSDTNFITINVVNNLSPSNIDFSSPSIAPENTPITISGSFTNPDGDAHTVTINFGDGSTPVTLNLAAGEDTFTATHTYLDDDPSGTSSDVKNITATVSDGVNSAQRTRVIEVRNIAPQIVTLSATPTVAGGLSTITVNFIDPGTLDPKLITFDFGDGSPLVNLGTAPGASSATITHVYATVGTFTVTATVNDDDLGSSSPGQATVNVADPVPVVIPPVSQTSTEGASTQFLLGSFVDANNSGNYTVTVNWGDGTPNTVFNQADTGAVTFQNHTFAQDGVFTVTITVADVDGTSTPVSFLATVQNVLPIAVDSPDQFAVATIAQSFDLGSFSDPGDDTPWTVTVNWGDGSPDGTFTVNTPGTLPPLTHAFATAGTFNVVVTINDDDGFGTSDYLVNVIPPEAHVLGNVFRDFNRDGSFNTTDRGQSGVVVFADRDGDGVLDINEPTATTDLNGNYDLIVGFEGAVHVRQVVPEGFTQTTDDPALVNVNFGGTVSVDALGLGRIVRPIVAVAGRTGNQPFVQVRDVDGTLRFSFTPYATVKTALKDVRLATGDVNDDGIEDIFAVPGPGIAGAISIFSGADGQLLRVFSAFSFPYTRGLSVAAGDVNGDGVADVWVGTDPGAGPVVRVFDGATTNLLKSFTPVNATQASGVRVAAGDVNGDGVVDIITTPGLGNSTNRIRVMAFNALSGSILQNYVVAKSGSNAAQIGITAGDLDGDGRAETLINFTKNGRSELLTFSNGSSTSTATWKGSAIQVAAKDLNGDGIADLLFAGSAGQLPRIAIKDGSSGLTLLNALILSSTQKKGLFIA